MAVEALTMERMAVRAESRVCPEKIPLLAAACGDSAEKNPCWGLDAPTTAREWDLPSYGYLASFGA